ncbi:hypothetical protein [Aeromicrobium wangtongii]|uniref:hypothetical protein n=1 Tax=Aeromicrobium wangtongii TaxID=2969247 RepID=UPI002018164F|nr:hypothetical protein [Aeromicrobium wangtongii]MCL3818016.1 hypothetical protein [Aeromicrobium wangtongii]
MTRTRLLTALATTPILLLGACGSSDEPEAAAPSASEPSTSEPTTPAPSTVPTTPAATTPAPSKSTSTPTPAAPAGKLISYAQGEDSGVMIATPAETSKLRGAPADFKSFIAAELTRGTVEQGCTEKPQISVDVIDTAGFARGGHFTPQCGGYASLWAKSGGTWRSVWNGQSLTECSVLTKYKFPARVAGKQCLQGDDTVTYSG